MQNQDKGEISNCHGGTENVGAGGPVALQTSPLVRRREPVDMNPHAALAGLTCRASPANPSVAGAAPLDSVRLRRNRALLLCVSQSSSLTCARGAHRACSCTRSKLPVRHFPDVIIQWTILNSENIYRLKQSFSSQNF